MLTIENIEKVNGTMMNFDSEIIFCTKVEQVNDSIKNSYTFEFDIGLPTVELVIWLDRNKDIQHNGYCIENNLVDAVNHIDIENLKTYSDFQFMLQDYLDSIQPEIKRNFFTN